MLYEASERKLFVESCSHENNQQRKKIQKENKVTPNELPHYHLNEETERSLRVKNDFQPRQKFLRDEITATACVGGAVRTFLRLLCALAKKALNDRN